MAIERGGQMWFSRIMRKNILLPAALTVLAVVSGSATAALAHASGRAIILLLPTAVYIRAGVLAVAATVVLVALVPDRLIRRIFALDAPAGEAVAGPCRAQVVTSTASALFFIILLAVGAAGSPDPLENPLPLMTWTVFWAGIVVLQALVGDIWAWINPWSGPAWLLFGRRAGSPAPLVLPKWLGVWPAWGLYLAFGAFLLTDIAPSDPRRLTWVAGAYWLVNLGLCGLFGAEWLRRGEALSVLLSLYARLAPISRQRPFVRLPGQTLVRGDGASPSLAVFVVTVLAIGAFDGMEETFWWLGHIGINPLAFPGRSGVMWQNRAGLGLAVIALVGLFGAAVWAGAASADARHRFGELFARLGLTVLPIAFAYHLAHYLTSALVGFQYTALALNDPLETGATLLGLNAWDVTTSFFGRPGPALAIWLTQAGVIVLGHMLAVVMAHAVALDVLGNGRRALLAQIPLALLMVGLTLFGLWLLASPAVL